MKPNGQNSGRSSDFRNMRNQMPHVAWPAMVDDQTAPVMNLIRLFDETQWLPEAELRAHQFLQLGVLAAHCAAHSDYFARRLEKAGLRAQDLSDPDAFRQLDFLTRRDIQTGGESIFCRSIPSSHGQIFESRTSGSTGEPLIVHRTGAASHYWLAYTMRDHFWHQRDFSGSLAVIRGRIDAQSNPEWGLPTNLFFATGPAHLLSVSTNIVELAAWLAEHNPAYVVIYPNTLSALVDHIEAEGIRLPNLRQVRTIGEMAPERLPGRVREVLGIDMADLYSAQEVGVIAIQCPVSGLYHVMAENLIVEVLDEEGAPCPPGAVGRVVLTDLHNFATPLIRYAIGDHAEVGPPCPCGRGLPTLRRIKGKSRNMMIINGGKRWPSIGGVQYNKIAPIRQFQYIQKSEQLMELRLVVDPALMPDQEELLRVNVRKSLQADFDIRIICYPDRLPPNANGKMEEFICEVPG